MRLFSRLLIALVGVVAAPLCAEADCTLSATPYDLASQLTTVSCLSGSGTITNTGATAKKLTISTTTVDGAYTGTIENGPSGTVALEISGGGTVTLTGANGYSGTTSLGSIDPHRSSLANTQISTLVTDSTLVVAQGALGTGALGLVNSTLKSAGGAITLANNIAVGGATYLGPGQRYGQAIFDTSAGDITLNGVLVGHYNLGDDFSRDGGIIKVGSGTLILAPLDKFGAVAPNEYAGGTWIQGGTIQISAVEALGRNSPTVTIYGGATLATTADMDGSSMTVNIKCAVAGACGGATVSTATGTTLVLAGINGIDTGSQLVKAGAGTLVLTGASTYDGGTSLLAGTLVITDMGALGTGGLDMADGTTLSFEGVSGEFTNTLLMSGSEDPTISVSTGSTVTLSGVLSGTSALTKTGGGTLILPVIETYTGNTNVAAGTLQIDGSIASSPLTTVSSGSASVAAVLSGTGTIGALTVDYGTVAPGNAAAPTGTLTATGAVGFSANSTLAISVSSTGASRLVTSGAATLAGTVSATLLTGSATPAAGTRYTILTATGGVSGTFGGLLTYGFGGTTALLSYDANNVYLTFGPSGDVVAKSVTQLVRDRQGQMITGRILGSVLLGSNEQISCSSSCISAFGAVGSFQAGVHGRAGITDEFSLLGGLAWAAWDSGGARSESAPMLALALRWDPTGFGSSRPYAEIGVTTTPWARTRYSRSYELAGIGYVGRGSVDTSSMAVFGKLGWVARVSQVDELAASVELWTGWMRSSAYSESAGMDNPAPASYGAAVDRMNVAKVGGQWTHLWNRRFETQINLGIASSFASQSSLKAGFAGYGDLTGSTREAVWGEYGLRLGWRMNNSWVADIFADGTLGEKPVGNTIHGGLGLRHAF